MDSPERSPGSRAIRYFWLNVHVGYACRDSGACCASGWPIPIERDRAATVEAGIAPGLVTPAVTPWIVADASAPAEMAGVLALQPDGHCVWHQRSAAAAIRHAATPRPPDLCTSSPPPVARGCAIHSMRPLSCVHFPYVCLTDARGVRVTLSHYCPTAAALLFDHAGPVEIVEGPPPIAGIDLPEGLDAREALPPLSSPNRLMSYEAFSTWERRAIADLIPDRDSRLPAPDARVLALFHQARAAVPAPLAWPGTPVDMAPSWHRLVEPSWNTFRTVVGHYLAAKLFASWAAYLGDGLPDVLRSVEQARAVLQVEAVRQCVRANRALDAALLKEAIRRSDLLLVHYADRQSLISCTPAS